MPVLLTIATCFFHSTANPHFRLNQNVRILHIERHIDGLHAYVRLPLSYLLADKYKEVFDGSLPEAVPFTTNAIDDGNIVHFVDPEEIQRDPNGLAQFLEHGLVIEVENKKINGLIELMAIYRIGDEPSFATLNEAKEALKITTNLINFDGPLFVGDALVDVEIKYLIEEPFESYTVSSKLNPGLDGQEGTANLIIDYGPGHPQVYRARGLLASPIEITRSRFAGTVTFIKEGVHHIIEGLDHVLFVICLALGAASFRPLLLRVTGFTIGHSLTLGVGFFGYFPTGAWFIPAVETAIALSIIYAALVAIRPSISYLRSEAQTVSITTGIGLLHGLGFGFVLQEILKVNSPNIWLNILSFNIGVEVGQILIILFTWPAFMICAIYGSKIWKIAKITIGLSCIFIAAYWSLERVNSLFVTFAG